MAVVLARNAWFIVQLLLPWSNIIIEVVAVVGFKRWLRWLLGCLVHGVGECNGGAVLLSLRTNDILAAAVDHNHNHNKRNNHHASHSPTNNRPWGASTASACQRKQINKQTRVPGKPPARHSEGIHHTLSYVPVPQTHTHTNEAVEASGVSSSSVVDGAAVVACIVVDKGSSSAVVVVGAAVEVLVVVVVVVVVVVNDTNSLSTPCGGRRKPSTISDNSPDISRLIASSTASTEVSAESRVSVPTPKPAPTQQASDLVMYNTRASKTIAESNEACRSGFNTGTPRHKPRGCTLLESTQG